ncbi:hypothetical protein GPX89_11240 [Nocardia sp. ET3-3]|uniref:TrbL/VirB6 plasmid conjugal transfer protein n=1 Tax=Nocardia terrae TaxID=2675851 RepID=A0A7K1UTX7_9NOCA|nr:hypothetical protein [Nocardia terrae]MVU77816.1 hypothetical protein [Nocardia terrae]
MLRRLVTILAVVFTVMIATPTVAYGQTYGYDQACNELHDSLDGLGVPGLSLGDAASAACKASNVATHPGDAAATVRDKAWDSTFGKVVDSLMNGLGEALILALTFWMKLPNDRVSDAGTLFTKINDYTYQAQILLLMVSVILTGLKLAQARRGAAVSEATDSFWMFARVVFSSWMLGAVIVAATQASDKFSEWIINDSTGGNAKDMAELMVKTTKLQAFSPGLVLIIAIVGLLGALAQIVLAIVRQGMLVVAAGVLPLAAAGSGTGIGRSSYSKLIRWIIAFMLYKPVAAIVYMIAFTTAGATDARTGTTTLPDADEAQRMLVAIVLLGSVAFVLPALMRLATAGEVAIVGSGGSGLAATTGTLVGIAALGAVGSRAVAPRAVSGAPGYAGRGGRPGRPGGPGGPGGGGLPRPTPQPRPGGGGGAAPNAASPAAQGGGGAVPSGASRVANRVAQVRAATASLGKAENTAGDVAGDRWVNRSPDLGRSTIPR